MLNFELFMKHPGWFGVHCLKLNHLFIFMTVFVLFFFSQEFVFWVWYQAVKGTSEVGSVWLKFGEKFKKQEDKERDFLTQ